MSFFGNLFGKKEQRSTSFKREIEQGVDLYYAYYDQPERIAGEIEKIGLSDEDTTMLYLFIPQVFCRLLLPEIQYSKYYIVTNKAGKDEHRYYSDSPIFCEMVKTIEANWEQYVQRDLMKVLFYSPDFKAANQMLGKGSELKNLQSVPPRIMAS
jgi:hypothetical protein